MTEKELRLLRALTNELRALREEIQAQYKYSQATQDPSNNKPVEPLRVEITQAPDLDPTRREYYESQKYERNSLWRRLKPWVEAAGVAIALVLALFTLLTFLEVHRQTPGIVDSGAAAKNAARTASDSLISVQRPFIEYRTLTNKNILDATGTHILGIEFQARYENTGTTPTRGARHRIGFKDFPNGMPADFDFRLNGRRLTDTVFAFGPKTTIDAGQVMVTKDTLDRLWAGRTHLYLWGWLQYRDVFRNTPDHITMFCVELAEIKEVSMPDLRKSTSEMEYTNCPKHNCEDEDCDGQPYGDGQIWHSPR